MHIANINKINVLALTYIMCPIIYKIVEIANTSQLTEDIIDLHKTELYENIIHETIIIPFTSGTSILILVKVFRSIDVNIFPNRTSEEVRIHL